MIYTCTHAIILFYSKYITVTDIGNIYQTFSGMHITTYTHICTYSGHILIQTSRRSYRAYTSTKVPVSTIELILVQSYP